MKEKIETIILWSAWILLGAMALLMVLGIGAKKGYEDETRISGTIVLVIWGLISWITYKLHKI